MFVCKVIKGSNSEFLRLFSPTREQKVRVCHEMFATASEQTKHTHIIEYQLLSVCLSILNSTMLCHKLFCQAEPNDFGSG